MSIGADREELIGVLVAADANRRGQMALNIRHVTLHPHYDPHPTYPHHNVQVFRIEISDENVIPLRPYHQSLMDVANGLNRTVAVV